MGCGFEPHCRDCVLTLLTYVVTGIYIKAVDTLEGGGSGEQDSPRSLIKLRSQQYMKKVEKGYTYGRSYSQRNGATTCKKTEVHYRELQGKKYSECLPSE